MNLDTKETMQESRAYTLRHRSVKAKGYKGKHPDLKCEHYVKIGHLGIGHIKDRCYILHLELKPKFNKDGKGTFKIAQNSLYKAIMQLLQPLLLLTVRLI